MATYSHSSCRSVIASVTAATVSHLWNQGMYIRKRDATRLTGDTAYHVMLTVVGYHAAGTVDTSDLVLGLLAGRTANKVRRKPPVGPPRH